LISNRSVRRWIESTYELEDETLVLGGRNTYEYDSEFRRPPRELAGTLRTVLLAPGQTAIRGAWRGLHGSFSFEHLLTDDVAYQIYGLRLPGEEPLLRLDADGIAGPGCALLSYPMLGRWLVAAGAWTVRRSGGPVVTRDQKSGALRGRGHSLGTSWKYQLVWAPSLGPRATMSCFG
jgi:hypothetical protein